MPDHSLTHRRLAAVFFADIVGYSRLADVDEDGALRQVLLFQRLARERIEAGGGTLVKFSGDAVLAEFTSTAAAARSARALTDAFRRESAAAGRGSTLRVGVHVGDVASAADGDLYGAGVNAAARLQEAATPGEVLVTESVWRQLRRRSEFGFAARGERVLKGFSEPERVFALRPAGAEPAEAAQGTSRGRLASLWAEIRRRSVFRVAVVYAALAWLIIQVVAIAFPALHLPGWTITLVVALVLLGFPVALVLAWAFELTPAGVRRTDSGSGRDEIPSPAPHARVQPAAVARDERPMLEEPTVSMRSIAVLPFENLSGTEQAAPFAAGLHDDLITELSRISALTVISRTSVLHYRGADRPIRDIARELGVGTVVEGGVQSAGGRVRLNVQLIDAGSDAHRWVERYDRELSTESIFDIQSELAQKIARSLRAELTPGEERRIDDQPTDDLDAYRLHVQGRGFLDQRTEGPMRQAVEYFNRAIERDSGYALAWVGLADALSLLHDYGYEDADSALPRAERAARRALELDPELAEVHASLGEIHSLRREGPAAIRELKRAVELRPSYAEAHNWLSWVYQCLGRREEALESAKRAVEQDPLSPEAVSNVSGSSVANGLAEEGLRAARRMRELSPNWASASFYEGLALYRLGRFGEAMSALDGISVPWVGAGPLATLALAHSASGDGVRAREIQAQFEEDGDPFSVGLIHTALGEKERAFDAFQRVEHWGAYWPTLAVHQYFPDLLGPLHDDARWEDIMRNVNRAWGLEQNVPHPSQGRSGRTAGNGVSDASIAVLPFEALGQEKADPFSEGTHDDLLTRLSNLSGLEVTSRTSVMRYRGTEKSLPAIARELGVAWVLEGSLQRVSDQIRVRARLVNARIDRQVWAEEYQRELTAKNLFRIQGEITQEIARALEARLTPEEQRHVEWRPTENLDAYRLHVQGRGRLHERSESSLRQAVEYFQRAVEQDSGYARAWAGLADALSMIEFYDFAPPDTAPDPMQAARRAVELAPDLGEAHASLGIVHSLRQEGPAALRELCRAVELQPSHAEAYVWLGWVYLVLGRPREALEPERRAVDLNPLAPAYRIFLAEAELANGEGQEALREARRAREIQPKYGLAHFMEGLILHHLGRLGDAKSTLRTSLSLVLPPWGSPTHAEVRAALAATHVASGDPAGARELLTQIDEAADPFATGLVHAALGEKYRAFEAFGRVERWGSITTEHIRYFFPDVLGPLRQDLRYEDLVHKVNRSWGLEPDGGLTPPA